MNREIQFQDLTRFRVPPGFRGRNAFLVVLWQFVQATLFAMSPQPFFPWRRLLLRLFGARIGRCVKIRPSARVTYPWKVEIGDYSWIGDHVELYSLDKITIGTNAVVSQRSYLCSASHNYTDMAFPYKTAPVVVEDQAWVASDVFIGPGVTVGRGTVVGARSTVLKSIPKGSIAFGHPAKVVGQREARRSAVSADRFSPLVFIGQFPPPVTGYSLATARLAERIGQQRPLDIVNIGGIGARGSLVFHLSRVARVAKALARIVTIRFGRGGRVVYVSCDGGHGVAYALGIAVVTRACGMALYIHHHSYGYIDRSRRLMHALLAIAGSRATHIVLSVGMAKALTERYGRPVVSVVLSNAALIPSEPYTPQKRASDAPMTLGMLSNLNAEKGLFVFLDLLEALQKAGTPCRGLLAGPLADESDRLGFEAMRHKLGDRLQWLGPVKGAAKKAFFEDIDLFVFPTLYANEAQPLVLFEAFERGVPVIAYDRGAIREQVANAGVVVPTQADFVTEAKSVIEQLLLNPPALEELSARARYRVVEEGEIASGVISSFCVRDLAD